jgi:hypothetical protein
MKGRIIMNGVTCEKRKDAMTLQGKKFHISSGGTGKNNENPTSR